MSIESADAPTDSWHRVSPTPLSDDTRQTGQIRFLKMRDGLKKRALNMHRDERRRREILSQLLYVRYDRPIAKVLWPPVSILHRQILPRLLRHAASHARNSTGPGSKPG
jgi:hypothetical protein